MSEKKTISRRRYLRNISAAGATGVGTTALSGPVGAVETGLVTELEGSEKRRAIATAKRSDEYRTLRASLRGDGKTLRNEERAAFLIEPKEGESFTAVMFSYERNAVDQSIEIGISLSGSSPVPSKATVVEHDDDGFPLRAHEFVISRVSDFGAQDVPTGDELVSRSITETTVRGRTVSKRSTELHREKIDRSDDTVGISVSAASDDFDEDDCNMDAVPCWACKNLVSAANVVGCGTYTWLICAAASIPTGGLAGLGCALSVGIVCWIILEKGVTNPNRVCSMKPACAC